MERDATTTAARIIRRAFPRTEATDAECEAVAALIVGEEHDRLRNLIVDMPTFTQRGSAGWLRKRDVMALLDESTQPGTGTLPP